MDELENEIAALKDQLENSDTIGNPTERQAIDFLNRLMAPTRRRVRPILFGNHPLPGPILVALDIHNILPVSRQTTSDIQKISL